MSDKNSRYRDLFTGVIGFSLGGILGNLFTYLIIISGVVSWLLNLIPESQPLVRLFTAIISAFMIIALGGAVTGIINGLSLNRIDREAVRGHYIFGSGYAFAIAQGILVIPIMLLISLISFYNNAPRTQPSAYLIFFGLMGLIFGLLIGLVLSLITVRVRFGWRVLLAAILGYTIGGCLFGLALYNANLISVGTSNTMRALSRLIVLTIAIYIPSGAALGLAYHLIAKKRISSEDEKLNPSRWQIIGVLAISLLIFVSVAGVVQQAKRFLTVRPGTTATQLSDKTVGVHWATPVILPVNAGGLSISDVGIAVNDDGFLVVGWRQESENGSDIYYIFQDTMENASSDWSDPVNVSRSISQRSSQPQLVVDTEGVAHIIWQEDIDTSAGARHILYSRCDKEECTLPALLSDLSYLTCAESASGENNMLPALAIDGSNNLMVTWSAGEGVVPYTTWQAGDSPPLTPNGCVPVNRDIGEIIQTRLAGGSGGMFTLVGSSGEPEQVGEIHIINYNGNEWNTNSDVFGYGSFPDVMLDQESQVHVAWCNEDQKTNYQKLGEQTKQIDSPTCIDRVTLGLDSHGQPHLVWFSDEVTNINGTSLPANLLYESILTSDGWSIPAISVQTVLPTRPDLATQSGDSLHLVWGDNSIGSDQIYYAKQEALNCSVEDLTNLGQVALAAMQSEDFHPSGYQVPFCRNQYLDMIYQPNPDPAFTDQPAAPNGGFDRVAALAATAQYEVLFTVMQWDEDENDLNPGSTFARAVATLYQKVKENPEKYPKGILVRILLGNYPTIVSLKWGEQIWNVLDDLRDEGVVEMENPEIGWKVEVANYNGTYPHAHTKFMIVDGRMIMASGFNYGWLHYSKDHPSGKGDDLVDLGIVIEGAVAQPAISAFDDMWIGANQIYCSDFFPNDGTSWIETCTRRKATGGHFPEVMKYYLAENQRNAFSFYRTAHYKEADSTYGLVLDKAQSSIDAIHVNFSLELICYLNLVVEDFCTFDNSLPWMQAIMNAVEQNHVKVRIIVENANSNGLENRVGIDVFEKELANRGLEDLVEVRFFNGRVHAKSALIDQEFLVIGSQNFHYSAWGDEGLLEYGVATDDIEAIAQYQKMFDYYWEQAIPAEEADWTNTG